MKCLLIGFGRVDYVSKKTGKNIKGWNLYITRQPSVSESVRVTGEIAERFYVPDSFDVNSFSVGSFIDVSFNRFGGIDTIVSA